MRKGLLALAVLAGLVCAPSAHAAKPLVVGIGDQKPAMFTDARMKWLGIKHARLVVPWYVASGVEPQELAYVDSWLKAARRAGVQPLVGFGHGFSGFMRIYRPKPAEYRRNVRLFRKRYPWVKRFIAWNEANHCSQPTCRYPERAAQYFDAVKSVCPSCTVVAADLIDQPNMVKWFKRFRKKAKHKPTVVGLHNYLDVNRLRITGTRKLIKAVPRGTRIWITETGGVVRRKHFRGRVAEFPETPEHAGKVTSYLLRWARRLPRIDRVYLYHWNADSDQATWDSGLIGPRGVGRPGLDALARHLRRDPRTAPKPPPAPVPPSSPPPPVGENPPPPSSGGGSSPPPPEEEPECSLLILCDRPLGLG
jgi:hypothetical protein